MGKIGKGWGLEETGWFNAVPKLDAVEEYITAGCVPGGTTRNFDSYGHLIAPMTDMQRNLLCDPQTSGGLLLAVRPDAVEAVQKVAAQHNLTLSAIGEVHAGQGEHLIEVTSCRG